MKSFSFDSGGSPSDFVNALSSVTNEPIIFAESRPLFSRIILSPQNLRLEYYATTQLCLKLHQSLGELPTENPYFGFNMGCLEPTTMWRNCGSINTISAPPIEDKVEITNGFVSSKGTLRLMAPDLESLKWSKKLILDPLFDRQPLVLEVKRSREEVVIRAIAQALAATVAETPTSVTIIPDYSKLGSISSNSAAWTSKTFNLQREEWEAISIAYKSISKQQLELLLTKKLSSLEIPRSQFGPDFFEAEKKALLENLKPQDYAPGSMFDADFNSGTVVLSYLRSPLLRYESADGKHGIGF